MLGRPKRATARPKPPLIAATALAAASLVAGCKVSDTPSPAAAASSPPPPSAVTTPTTASPGTTATASPQSESDRVRFAYKRFWEAWDDANNPPDPSHPDLERYYTGSALEKARNSIAKNKADGVTINEPHGRGGRHVVTEIEIVGAAATLKDCSIDDGQIVFADGRVKDGGVKTNLYEITLAKADADWKVSNVKSLKQWDGETSCES